MSADFSGLGLVNEELPEVPVGELPETGGFDLVQPGFYNFKLPSKEALFAGISVINDAALGQRLKVSFRRLKDSDVNSSLWIPELAKSFSTSVTNKERKQGEDLVSDLALLLQAVGVKGHFKSNQEYANALLNAAGVIFAAEVEWTAGCNAKAPIYTEEGTKGDKNGCGQSYKQRAFEYKKGPNAGKKVFAIPQDANGKFHEKFLCATEGCGGVLRAFGNLRNFRVAK